MTFEAAIRELSDNRRVTNRGQLSANTVLWLNRAAKNRALAAVKLKGEPRFWLVKDRLALRIMFRNAPQKYLEEKTYAPL